MQITPRDTSPIRADPLGCLAEAAGYSDSDLWWEHMVEQRHDSSDLFAAILEAMTVLRAEAGALDDPQEARREASMRQAIRAAQREGFGRLAVVCGAWHAPALVHMPSAREDAALLKGLPKVKVQATWVPWTYGRLSSRSGYGAGIASPGWYHHVWTATDQVVTRWMARVARLLRAADLDASPAQVIEAVRLAETLAALRDRPMPGLPELNEAVQTVLCFGSDVPMRLMHEQLIVGETLGSVPDHTPMVALQQDLAQLQRRLRLPAQATRRDLDLDLRKPLDLERSYLLHRLTLLGVSWGQRAHLTGAKGTFHELWQMQWRPELSLHLIEASIWGNTIVDAATAHTCEAANTAADLPALTRLLDLALLADLSTAVAHLMQRLEAEAALASDVAHLMEALPALAQVLRYGNVRRTDASLVSHVLDGLVTRICIGLPVACAALNDAAAAAMFERLLRIHEAVLLLQNHVHIATWQGVLQQMAVQPGLHGLLAGRCCRLLLDGGVCTAEEAARRLGLALSTANDPAPAAAWIEGFLTGSGLLLLHDATLWQVLDAWLSAMPAEAFTQVLPLLRRTFATFPAAERRQMGEQVRSRAGEASGSPAESVVFDSQRAAAVLEIVGRLLGTYERSLHS